MVRRNDVNGVDEVTGTTARWFAANAIAISRAEFERLNAVQKQRGAHEGRSPAPTSQAKVPQAQRYSTSVDRLTNGIEEESPTLTWDPSHLSVATKKMLRPKRESAAVMDRSTARGNEAEKARVAGRPNATATTRQQSTAKQAPRPTAGNTIKVWPQTPSPQSPSKITAANRIKPSTAKADTRVAPPKLEQRSSVKSARQVAPHAPPAAMPARTVPPPPRPSYRQAAPVESPRPQQQQYTSQRLAKGARSTVAASSIKQRRMGAARLRVWAWNASLSAALFVLVLAGRLIVTNSPVASPQTPVPVAATNAPSQAIGRRVDAVGSNAVSNATSAAAVNSATPEPNRVTLTPPGRTTRGAHLDAKPTPRRTVTALHSRSTTASSSATLATGTLRINSRPWSQVFVDDNLVGNTPQMAIELKAGRHTVKLVNESLGLTNTFAVHLEPGQTLTRIVSLIE